MILRLLKLYKLDLKVWEIRTNNLNIFKKVNKVLDKYKLLFVSIIIWTMLIGQYPKNLLTRHFNINKTPKFIKLIYFNLKKNIKV